MRKRKRMFHFCVAFTLIGIAFGSLSGCGDENLESGLDQAEELSIGEQTPRYIPTDSDVDTPIELERGENNPVEVTTTLINPDGEQLPNPENRAYNTWEDALDGFAYLMGLEYDLLMETLPIEDFGTRRLEASVQAHRNVQERIYETNEYPNLLAAMLKFLDDFPMFSRDPTALLVRAGRWPVETLPNVFRLPNGELFTLEIPSAVHVRYQRAYMNSKTGEPFYAQFLVIYRCGDESDPGFKVVELDLGLIDDEDD